jgi:D-lyxose ketol-isomerase
MKRSEVNAAVRAATACFSAHHWVLPPSPRWDVTDFGLGEFQSQGLTLINLAEEPEYCEKLMFAFENQVTPLHTHKKKKEDIIVRWGRLCLELWEGLPNVENRGKPFPVFCNGKSTVVHQGIPYVLNAGERITLIPGIYHAFWPVEGDCIIGEVSTANDDQNDNFFVDERIGRFSQMEENEPALVQLVSDKTAMG